MSRNSEFPEFAVLTAPFLSNVKVLGVGALDINEQCVEAFERSSIKALERLEGVTFHRDLAPILRHRWCQSQALRTLGELRLTLDYDISGEEFFVDAPFLSTLRKLTIHDGEQPLLTLARKGNAISLEYLEIMGNLPLSTVLAIAESPRLPKLKTLRYQMQPYRLLMHKPTARELDQENWIERAMQLRKTRLKYGF